MICCSTIGLCNLANSGKPDVVREDFNEDRNGIFCLSVRIGILVVVRYNNMRDRWTDG